MELTLFVIVGAVAVAAAAMMLISENAIHSALFLILNFACIAFFFLMLHAPFLAMVQITVYAGAIMVLFLFVIMLLGAERVVPGREPHFPWLSPAAVILALIFLGAASVAIIEGEIDLTESKVVQPHVRVVHVLDGVDQIDVYLSLDDDPVARGVAFGESSDFETWTRGRYSVTVFAAGADPLTDTPLYPLPGTPLPAQQVELNSGEAISLVMVNTLDGPHLAVASEDVSTAEDDSAHVVAVNALHGRSLIDVLDETGDHEVLIHNVAYGEASEAVKLDSRTYKVGVYPDDDHRNLLLTLQAEKLESNTSVLWVFAEQRQEDNSWRDVVLSLKTDARPSFGSPAHVGQLLFSQYVLPFEMIALVLLVAMIGAIVLTHESLKPRRRVVRQLARPPVTLDQPASGESGE